MSPGLRGGDLLLDATQKLLRLAERQTQFRNLAQVAMPAEFHHVNPVSRNVCPRLDQPQNPPHPC